MTSTLTQYEFDRLELALQNSRHHWVQPKVATDAPKRPLQLAFEEIENLRRARPLVQKGLMSYRLLHQAALCIGKYPRSSKARRFLAYAARNTAAPSLVEAREILSRKANVCRPDGTEEHA